jgi:hypothetical protein
LARTGISVKDGIVHWLDVKSPEHAAMDNWGVDSVQPDELPKLRALSDLTWGTWEKVVRKEVDDKTLLTNIKYFMVHSINNEITAPIIIPRALHIIGAEDGREIWPDRDVLVGGNPGSPDEQRLAEHEAAKALIGAYICFCCYPSCSGTD